MSRTITRQSFDQQLSQQLEDLIRRGAWPAGQKVPSMRKLAEEYEVSVRTAHLAVRDLESRGLVERAPNGRSFVRTTTAATQKTTHIAMIGCNTPTAAPDEWSVHILLAAEAELLAAEGFYVTRIQSANSDPEGYYRMLSRQVDQLGPSLGGAIIFQSDSAFVLEMMKKLDNLGLPWVSINHPSDEMIHNFVSADNTAAGRTVGRCFVLNGFEKILILGRGLDTWRSAMNKVTGLFEAYLGADVPTAGIQCIPCESVDVEEGRRRMLHHLERNGPPQAVFASGDLLAIGAMRALEAKGFSVPGDVSVIGSTGLHAATLTTPTLSVVPQPMEEMGRTAARMLVRMIQTGERRLPGRQLNGGLIVRESLKLSPVAIAKLTEEGILSPASMNVSE